MLALAPRDYATAVEVVRRATRLDQKRREQEIKATAEIIARRLAAVLAAAFK